eukprot:9002276-Pyramimonas_sp.AAC.2
MATKFVWAVAIGSVARAVCSQQAAAGSQQSLSKNMPLKKRMAKERLRKAGQRSSTDNATGI